MRGFTRSFIKHIARGGVLAGGVVFMMGGCVAGGEPDGEGTGDDAVPVVAGNDSVIMCHYNGDGTFSDVLVDESSVVDRLAGGDVIGACAQSFCGDS